MAIIQAAQAGNATLRRLNGSNNAVGNGPRFAPNQAERWLCAEPVTTASGTQVNVTLRAKQKCWVDASRLIVQAFNTAENGTALAPNPFNQDLNVSTFIQQITFKGDQKMVQGSPTSGNTSVDCPANFFSAGRDITGWHLMSSGEWFEMNTQDTIVIQTIQTSALAGKLLAAVPCVLECDLGLSAYPPSIEPPGSSFTGAQVIASTQSSSTAIGTAISLSLTLNQAGVLNWNALQVGGAYINTGAATSSGGVTTLPFTTSYITSLKNFTESEMIQGVPDTSGNDLGLPLAVYAGTGLSGEDRAGFPWCRLQALTGNSGNAATMSINSAGYPAGATHRRLSVAAPFYGSPQDPLACR